MSKWIKYPLRVRNLYGSKENPDQIGAFLVPAIKEDVVSKHKKQRSKAIRIVLTENFLHYFPNAHTSGSYHSIHLLDCELVPVGQEKNAFFFRINNQVRPLLLSCEKEEDYQDWLEKLSSAISNNNSSSESFQFREIDVKAFSETAVNFVVSIEKERITIRKKQELGQMKVYEMQVSGFGTSWTVEKTYADFVQLYRMLNQLFGEKYFFPEIIEEPLYTEGLSEKKERNSLRNLFANNKPKIQDASYDFKYITCLVREIFSNLEVAQSQTAHAFCKVDDIFTAVSTGNEDFLAYVVKTLKKQLDMINPGDLLSPLTIAAKNNDTRMAECLLGYGATINFKNGKGESPLLSAAHFGYHEMLVFLLERGADPFHTDKIGNSLMHHAAKRGDKELLNSIMERVPNMDLDVQNDDGKTPLHVAIFEGNVEAAEFFIERECNCDLADQEGYTPLLASCWKGKREIVEVLLSKHIRVNAVDKLHRSAVHFAAFNKNLEILEMLFERGAILNVQNKTGMSPLHMAATKGFEEVVEFLLSKGAVASQTDGKEEQTPLHMACRNDKIGVVQILLNYSKDIVNAGDIEGKTALHLASENGNVSITKILLDHGASPDELDLNGNAPLHIAAATGDLEIIKLLMSKKSKVNILHVPNGAGYQPLHLAVRDGNNDIVTFLLSQHADVNAKDSTRSQNTPLHIALINKHLITAVLLCENGASLTVVNSQENTPLYYAPQKVHQILMEAAQQKLQIRPSERQSITQFRDHSERLLKIIDDPNLSIFYREFLHEHFNNENLSFWLEVEDFKKTEGEEELKKRGMEIYKKYLQIGSDFELNVSNNTRKNIKKELAHPNIHIYDILQKEIWELMAVDSVPKFLKSDYYRMFKEGEKAIPKAMHRGTISYLEKYQKSRPSILQLELDEIYENYFIDIEQN